MQSKHMKRLCNKKKKKKITIHLTIIDSRGPGSLGKIEEMAADSGAAEGKTKG